MAHAPGVGYNQQRATAKARPVPPAPAPAPAPSRSDDGVVAGPSMSMPSISLPSASIPGANAGEKALVVAGILILGMGVYSRITGKQLGLSLPGLTGTAAAGLPTLTPAATVASQPLPVTTAAKTAAANPAKLS